MKKIIFSLIIVAFGCLALHGETFEHQDGGVSIWFPDNWKVTTDGNVLEAEAPTQDAFAQLLVLKDARSLEEGVNAYIREVKKNIKRFNITKQGNQIQRNGLTFYFVEGEGMLNGIDVGSGAAIILTRRAIVLMMTLDTEKTRRHHRKEFDQIISSIRAL